MLDDRDYMRNPDDFDSGWRTTPRLQWSWTVILLIAYAVVFLMELLAAHYQPGNLLFNSRETWEANKPIIIPGYLPLSVEGLAHGYVWQLVSYQFMHSGWLHLILNGWVIYLFGRELESLLGGGKFLTLMFASGILGGIFQVLVAMLWPEYFGGSVVGASACAFGLVAAYAAMFPHRELQLLLFFIIPMTLRAKTLLIGSAVMAMAGFSFPKLLMPGVAHAAHLGGMVMGWVYVRMILAGHESGIRHSLPAWMNSTNSEPSPGEESAKKNAEGVNPEEIDAILDKISARGIQSLTKRERETLEAARRQMGSR